MASPDVSQNGPGTRRIDSIHHYAEPTGPISLLRARTRKFLETLKVEFVTIGVVIVYMILIFLDLMLDKETRPGQLNAIEDGMPWTKAFMWIDLVFLVIFTLELFLRIFAFGYYYFWNALNVIDGLVVFTSFVLQVWIITLVDEVVDEGAGQAQSALALLRLLRLVRLFVVMNKVQKARDAYRKTKYLKLGARAPPLAPSAHPSPTLGLGPCRRLGCTCDPRRCRRRRRRHRLARREGDRAAGRDEGKGRAHGRGPEGHPMDHGPDRVGQAVHDQHQQPAQRCQGQGSAAHARTADGRRGAGRGREATQQGTPEVATAPAQRCLLRRAEMSDFLQQEVGIKGGLDLDGNTSVADSDDLTSLSQAQLSVSRFSLDTRRWVPRW